MPNIDDDLGPQFIRDKDAADFREARDRNDALIAEGVPGERTEDDAPQQALPPEEDADDGSFLGREVFGAAARGAITAVESTIDAVDHFTSFLADKTGALAVENSFRRAAGLQEIDPENLDFDINLPKPGEPQSGIGKGIEVISQFIVGFAGAGKLLKPIQAATKLARAGKASIQGALSDAFAFDAAEGNLSNMLEEFPALSNPISEFLATDPEDNEALNRFKRGLEGLGLGAATEGVIAGVQLLKASRALKAAKAEALEADAALKVKGDGPEAKVLEEAEEAVSEVDLGNITKEADEFVENPDAFIEINLSPAEIAQSAKRGEVALNVNLGRINTPEDIDAAILEVAGALGATKRGAALTAKQGQAQTKKLAEELGLTVEELVSRTGGEGVTAVKAVAARSILAASGDKLLRFARKADSVEASEVDLIAFRQVLAKHAAIQAQVSKLTAEAGRALNSFNIKVGTKAERDKLIRDLLETSGGEVTTRDMARKLASHGDTLTKAQLNKVVRGGKTARTADAFLEAWINGLLSNPATIGVNLLGNAISVLWNIADRQTAGMIARLTGEQGVAQREAVEQVYGMIAGSKEGWQLAKKTLVSGETTDPLTKIDIAGRSAISSEAFELSGRAGQAVDFIGQVIRTPGRALLAGDEFFKSVGYRMELNALAIRKASAEGLEGVEAAARMRQIVENPTGEIRLAAQQQARYQTFTKELGPAGKSIQKFVTAHPALRLIAPFIRTPINLVKFAGERTPFALAAPSIRKEIAAGGARKQLALAKVATGSMIMATTSELAARGLITGNGPVDPEMRAIWLINHQPNSINVFGTWFAYSRLDPIGITIGLAASFTEIIGYLDEADGWELAGAAIGAITENVVSKTYLSGLADLFDIMSDTGPATTGARAKAFVAKFTGTLLPFSSLGAQIVRIEDPVRRDKRDQLSAWNEIKNEILTRVPVLGYSKDLPAMHNVLGDVILLTGGLGPDIISPVYTSSAEIDPVAEEIFANGVPVSWPSPQIMGVPLSPQEKERYTEIAGKLLRAELTELFNSPSYLLGSVGPDGERALEIQEVVQATRTEAAALVIEEFPELDDAIEQEIDNTGTALEVGGRKIKVR